MLDTFDMFSPAYHNPQRINTVAAWMSELGAAVQLKGFVVSGENKRSAVVRAIKRNSNASL